MPEGHTIHRAARDHHRILARQKLIVSSPQGDFPRAPHFLTSKFVQLLRHLVNIFFISLITNIHCTYIWDYSAEFENKNYHLAEPKSSVRIRLIGKKHLVDIIGPTICEVLDQKGVMALIGRIGPDVLTPRCKS